MAAEYELTLHDYISIIRRRIWQILVIFATIFVLSLIIAVMMPPVYESKGTILIESQQISSNFVESSDPIYADKRIEVIKQRVMTRDNLYKIIQKYRLYAKKLEKQPVSEVIEEMRLAIGVNFLSARAGRGAQTIAFYVSFEDEKPEVAHKVANELVTLFLDENVKARTEKATETTEFLSQEAETLRRNLEGIEEKLADYKQKYAGSLPEHRDMFMSMLQRTEREVNDINREYKSIQEELRYLDVELTAAKSGMTESMQGKVTADSELDKAKLELERALAVYSDSHPAVKALKRNIKNLESSISAEKAQYNSDLQRDNSVTTDLAVAKIKAQIDSANSKLVSLEREKKALKNKIDDLHKKISISPSIEKGMFSLMRGYENAKAKYEEVKSKQINAKIAENLEQENKAERFLMLEPPIFPEKPIRPNRRKTILFGIVLGLIASFGGVLLLETINGSVRSAEALSAITNVRTMATIPYIYTQAEVRRKKYLYKYIVLGFLSFVLIGLTLIHFLWMPLDMLMIKLVNRFD